MKKSTKLLIAFILGQAVQVVLHAVSMNFWENRRILFCCAAGFLVAVAVFAGVCITKDEKPMSYEDYARIPFDGKG